MPDENEQAQDSAEVTSIVLEGPPIPSASVFQPVAVDGSFSANSTLHTPAIDSTEISSLQSMGPMPDEKKTVVNIPETRRLSSSIFTWMIGFSIHFWSRISYHLTKIPIYKKFRKAFPASLPFLRIWPWMFPFAWLGFRSIGIASENGVDLSQKEKENSRRIDFLNQIFDACQINEWEVLARLLEAGKLSEEFQWISGDWEGAKGDSWECLLVACREGYSSIIKILLNYGCEDLPKVIDKSDTPVLKLERPFHAALNLTSKKKAFGGMTPFIAAVRWGKAFEFIPLLLEEGGDVTKMDAAGFSALTWAAYWNNAEVLRHLHKATIKALWDNCGDDFGEHEDPLVFQPSYKNIPQSQLDASNSSVKETEAPQYHLQKACDRALLVAARNFSYEVMDILIGDGRGGPGSACLDIDNMVSFEMLHRLTLAQLRRMAGNLKVKDIRQHTTFLAIVTGRLSPFIGVPILSTILPSLEGDLNFPLYDEFGARTSLIHFVCKPKTESEQWLKVMEGYHFVPFRRTAEKPLDAEFHAKLVSDVLTLLVKKKVDIDEIDPATGFTPLHVAVTHSNFDLVKCLLNLGADPNALSQKQTFTKLPRTGALNDGSAQMMESAFEHKSEGAKSLSIALDDSTRVGTGVISQRIMAVRRKKPNRAKTVQPPLEEVAASTSGIVPEVPSSSSIPALQVANQPETITQVTSSSSEVVSDVASSSSVPRPEPASMPQPLAETDSLDAARESTATSSSSSKRSNSKKDREASRGGLITPLHLAKRSNIAEILLDNGADLSIRSSISRRLPIHHLCQSLHDPKIFPTNKVEEGPLQGAFEESLNVIKIMTSPDAPEDWRTATDADGCTALHLAALENSPAAKAICKLLLERGIAWTIVNAKGFMAHDSPDSHSACASVIVTFLMNDAKASLYPYTIIDENDYVKVIDPSGTGASVQWTVQPLTMLCARRLRQERFILCEVTPRVMDLVHGNHNTKTDGSWIPPASADAVMSAEDIFHFATSSLSAFPEFSVSNFSHFARDTEEADGGGAKLRSAFLSSSPQRRQARSVQQRKRNQVSTALSFGKVQKHSLAVSPSTSPVKQGSLESTSSTGVLPKSTGFAFTFGDAATDTKSGLSFDILSNTLPSSSGVALFTFKGLDAGTDGANRDLALSAGLIDERRIVEEKETSSAS